MWQETGKKPKALKEMPEVKDHYNALVDSFYFLRNRTKTDDAISLTEISAYLSIVEQFDKERFLLLIAAMDRAWLTYQNQRSKNG